MYEKCVCVFPRAHANRKETDHQRMQRNSKETKDAFFGIHRLSLVFSKMAANTNNKKIFLFFHGSKSDISSP